MKPRSFKTLSAAGTKKLAKLLAQKLNRSTIALTGDLGAGKTTFIQGFANGLGIKRSLLSPTFLIIRSYRLKTKNYKLLYHIDCYRLKKPAELTTLGFKGILADPKNIILIEWAEKIKKLLPKNTLWLKFSHGQKENERIIEIHENSSSHRR